MTDSVDHLEIEPLARYLENHIEGFHGLRSAEKFTDGQSNPTFKLDAESGQYVLRRQPPGELLKSAHAVDREFRVIKALQDTDVPVPRTFHLCEDRDTIGSLFYVMSYEQGRTFWDARLPELSNDERSQVYEEMNRVLAALHALDYESLGLGDFGRPGNYYERQFARWSDQYRASETEVIEDMEALMTWLQTNMPNDDGQVSLIHGDYRMDNMIFHAQQSRVIALIDWELSTLGHPYADLAYQCMQLRIPPHEAVPGLGGMDRRALGIPSEEEYVTSYCAKRGISSIPNWTFYLAFGFFRFAAILQGVKKRALDGNASSRKALEYGALVQPLANQAVELI